MADFIIVAAAIVLVAVIAVRYVRRVGSGGCACGCSDSERAPKPKRVEVAEPTRRTIRMPRSSLLGA